MPPDQNAVADGRSTGSWETFAHYSSACTPSTPQLPHNDRRSVPAQSTGVAARQGFTEGRSDPSYLTRH